VPEAAGSFAREAVHAAGPASAVRARALLWACSRLAAWAMAVGLEPRPAVVLHPSVVERFVVVGLAQAPLSRRRSVRTNLRFVARHTGVGGWDPDPLALARSRAKAPYSPADIDAYLALARAQPTPARRMRLAALLCLGLGAGLSGADMRGVRGPHVARRSGGVVVEVVAGPCPRVVPVLARYHHELVAAARFAGGGYVIGGVSPTRHNVTNRLVTSVAASTDLARIDLGRMRASWLGSVATALGLPALFAAAGISHSQHVGDIVARLAVPDEAEMVRLIGGVI
jgi:hypothetical protein